jgi:PAS domain S-box-containing protein
VEWLVFRADLRTEVVSTAVVFLALVTARLVYRSAYRSVRGYRSWLIADVFGCVALLVLGFRGVFILATTSIVATHFFAVATFEMRYRGVREFLGLGPPRLASLLPHALGLILIASFVVERPGMRAAVNIRLTVVHLLLVYIGARTIWTLLRAPPMGLVREVRWLAGVAALTAGASVAMTVLVTISPIEGDIFAAGFSATWFFLTLDLLAISWSVFSLGLMSGWIEQRRLDADAARHRADEDFGRLLDESPLATAVVRTNGTFERLNRKFVEATGYTLDEVPDPDKWLALACPDPQRRADARAVWEEALEEARAQAPADTSVEIVLDYRDAPERTVELHLRQVSDRMVLQLVDVTELKAAMKLREQLVAAVSHDLRSPLSSIKLRAEAFLRDSQNEKLTVQLRSIRHAATSMERIIDELLDVVTLDAGGLVLERRPTSIGGLVTAVCEIVAPMVSKRSLELECKSACLPEALCDGERLMRVLFNLIDNAVKFTREGKITVFAEQHGSEVEISVKDTGAGIRPEALPRIFDRYFTTGSGGRGTGLGLYMAKEIVEAHGGRIWVRTEPGRGSTFSFTVPLSPAEQASAERPLEPSLT